MHASRLTIPVFLLCLGSICTLADDGPRSADGKPDLSGTYNIATLTPLERPEEYGERALITPEEAEKIAQQVAAFNAARNQASDPDREAPVVGGDGTIGPGGGVGGYNNFWVDPGDTRFAIEGKYRTSIIQNPSNGRLPELTPLGAKNRSFIQTILHKNTGKAWWMGTDAAGPYDDPEVRPLGERCLLGFGSTSGPPMLPVLYNNLKRIVQTPEYIMILVEMNHDARIIRMNAEHPAPEVRKWMGDSIGWWDGDTLVVDTANFREKSGMYLYGATESLHVTERFSRLDADTLLYSFTVEDPAAWKKPWSGEYPWPATEDRVFEYACHEGNYALGNIMRGARILEADWHSAQGAGGQ